MRLAVIPARGGSKRIPRKNIKLFAGKPMIAYAIEAAMRTSLIDRVIVSTDDTEIADIARERGAELPFIRPPSLADDITPTVPVIAHAIEECRSLGWEVEEVCCIYPGVPFIDGADLERALEHLRAVNSGGYAFPIAEYPAPIQRALRLHQDGTAEPFDESHTLTRTQDLEPGYFDAGQFYWADAKTWLDGKAIHSAARCIEIPLWRVVDIDTPADWDRAERLFRALHLAARPE